MKIVIAPSKTMKPQKVDWSLTPILFEKENKLFTSTTESLQ